MEHDGEGHYAACEKLPVRFKIFGRGDHAFGDVEGHYKMECLVLRIGIIIVRPQKGLLYLTTKYHPEKKMKPRTAYLFIEIREMITKVRRLHKFQHNYPVIFT